MLQCMHGNMLHLFDSCCGAVALYDPVHVVTILFRHLRPIRTHHNPLHKFNEPLLYSRDRKYPIAFPQQMIAAVLYGLKDQNKLSPITSWTRS